MELQGIKSEDNIYVVPRDSGENVPNYVKQESSKSSDQGQEIVMKGMTTWFKTTLLVCLIVTIIFASTSTTVVLLTKVTSVETAEKQMLSKFNAICTNSSETIKSFKINLTNMENFNKQSVQMLSGLEEKCDMKLKESEAHLNKSITNFNSKLIGLGEKYDMKIKDAEAHINRSIDDLNSKLYACPSIVFHFPTTAHTSYVRYLPRFPQITKTTLCAWVRDVEEARSTSHIASYATTRNQNDLLWSVRGRKMSTIYTYKATVEMDITFPLRTWTHICTWIDATANRAGTYLNGSLTEEKSVSFDPIPGGGVFMIGQEQDTVGGGFQASDTFWGSIGNLMIWPRVLSASEIHNIAHNCLCPGDHSVSLTPDKVEMVENVDYKFAGTCLVV